MTASGMKAGKAISTSLKLNLRNPAVINHILDKVGYWIDFFDIDGLRLDVAYCLDHEFLRRLREFTDSKKNEFFLLGGSPRRIWKDAG